MRAAAQRFDPFGQTIERLRVLFENGHPIETIELIVLGGTWSSYPMRYRVWFLARCFEAMNAIDWAVQAIPAAGRTFETIGILEFPSDYGFDYAEGVKIAAVANGLTVSWEETVIPVSAGGDPAQTEAVAKIVAEPADVIILVTGPSETAAIVGGAAQQLGANVPIFIGAAPSWNSALLASW